MSVTAKDAQHSEPRRSTSASSPTGSLGKLAVGAIGIVYGDIGTSPIYAFRETFAGHHTLPPTRCTSTACSA